MVRKAVFVVSVSMLIDLCRLLFEVFESQSSSRTVQINTVLCKLADRTDYRAGYIRSSSPEEANSL